MTVAQIPAAVLQQSADVKAADQDVAAAAASEKSAVANYYPKIEIKSALTHFNDDIVLDIPSQRIEKDLLGGQLHIGLDVDPPPITIQKKDLFLSHLVMTQPLYTGGRIGAGTDAAEAETQAAKLTRDGVYEQKVVEALTRYFQVQLATGTVQILQDISKDLDHIAQTADAAVKAGVAAKFSTYQIKVAKIELAARLTEATSKHKLAQLAFRSSTGIDMLTPVTFDSPLIVLPFDAPLDVLKTEALTKRREFGLLKAKAAQVAALKTAKTGEMLPTAYAFGSYELYRHDLPLTVPLWALGVGLDIPLTAGLKQGPERQRAAKLALKIADLRQKANTEIPLQVESLYDDAQAKKSAIATIDSGLAMAREALRLAEARLRTGAGSAVEVVKAATDLETMQVKRLLLTEAYNRSLIELYAAAGDASQYIKAYQRAHPSKGA